MKKITLFGVAAMSVLVAGAAMPQSATFMNTPQKIDARASHSLQRAASNGVKKVKNLASSRAGEDEEETPVTSELHYMSPETLLYAGMSPNLLAFTGPAIGGLRGTLDFINTTLGPQYSDDSFAWEWLDYDYETKEDVSYTADTRMLSIPVFPMQQLQMPTLTTSVDKEASYQADFKYLFCGGSLNTYGINGDPEDGEYNNEELPVEFTVGVSPTSAPIVSGGTTLFYETCLDRTDTEMYAENGLYKGYVEVLTKAGYTNAKAKGFAIHVPEQNSPYVLKHVFPNVQGSNKEEVTLTVKVYGRDAEGYWDLDNAVGTGTFTLPKGDYFAGSLGSLRVASIYSTDEEGYETDLNPVITTDIFVCIEGIDNENILDFSPIMNANAAVPLAEYRNGLEDYYYPSHTYWYLNCDYAKPGTTDEAQNMDAFLITATGAYYSDDTRTKIVSPTDALIFLDVEFPIIMNALTGDANFEASIPTDGGSEKLYVFTMNDFEQCYRDELITAESSASWLTFEVGYDETNELATVTVTGEALPSGTSGRNGSVKFTGLGYDFEILVTQGEAGISAVVANGNGVSEYYDLQGRRLNAAPAKGLYIERNGTTAATKLAR